MLGGGSDRSAIRRRTTAAIAIALVARLVAAGGPVEEFSASLDVVAVEIPVDVVRDGKPVRGLGHENFELYEDGERRELTGFEVVEHAPVPATEEAPAPTVERRNVLLLFDLLFATRVDRQRALSGARRFLDSSLGPADFAAVAVTGVRSGARLVVPFTTRQEWLLAGLDLLNAFESGRRRDVERAREALARFSPDPGADDRLARLSSELGPTMALVAGAPTDYLAAETPALGGGTDERFAEPATSELGIGSVLHQDPAEIAAELAASAISSTAVAQLDGVAALLAVLRDVPGRKLLLFFSRGLDPALIRERDSLDRAEILNGLERTAAAARRSGWAIHPVDLAGVPPADRPGFEAEPLLALATGTGGRLRENFNEFDEAAGRVLTETASSYRLTFQRPALVADGRLHPIEVRLVGAPAGARAVYRPGHQAELPVRSRDALQQRLDRAAEILGEREVAEIDADFAAFPRPSPDGRWQVTVALRVDDRWRERAALPGRELELEIAAYVVDAGLEIAGHFASRVRLDSAQHLARLERGGVHLLGEVVVPPGDYRLRVLVRDPATGRMALHGRALALSAPAIWAPLVAMGDGVAIALSSARQAPRAPNDPFAAGRPVLVPLSSLRAGRALELQLTVAGSAPGAQRLALRVVDARGQPADAAAIGEPARLDAADGLARWRARLDAAQLAPGAYALEISLAAGVAGDGRWPTHPFVVTPASSADGASAPSD